MKGEPVIRFLRSAEMAEAVALADAVFRGDGRASMGRSVPKAFSPSLQQSIGCFVDGTLASFAGLVPSIVRLGQARIPVFSYGAVCTNPAFRGQGYARSILQAAKAHAELAGASLLLVSGELPLYTETDCHKFGSVGRYRLENVAKLQPLSRPGGLACREADSADWFRLHALADARFVRYEQSVWDLADLIHAQAIASIRRMRHRTFLAEKRGISVAFCTAAFPAQQEVERAQGGESRDPFSDDPVQSGERRTVSKDSRFQGGENSQNMDDRAQSGDHRSVREDDRLQSGDHQSVHMDDRAQCGDHRSVYKVDQLQCGEQQTVHKDDRLHGEQQTVHKDDRLQCGFVVEYGGEPEAVAALLQYVASQEPLRYLEVLVPWHEQTLAELLKPVLSGMESNQGTVHIVNAERLLDQAAVFWQDRCGMSVGLPKVQLSDDNTHVLSIGAYKSPPLSGKQLVSFLFDCEPEALAPEPEWRKAASPFFPLPFPYTKGLNFV